MVTDGVKVINFSRTLHKKNKKGGLKRQNLWYGYNFVPNHSKLNDLFIIGHSRKIPKSSFSVYRTLFKSRALFGYLYCAGNLFIPTFAMLYSTMTVNATSFQNGAVIFP